MWGMVITEQWDSRMIGTALWPTKKSLAMCNFDAAGQQHAALGAFVVSRIFYSFMYSVLTLHDLRYLLR
jgi:hypothetical protein